MTAPADLPFQQLLDALLDTETPFHPRFLYRLSDLEAVELKQLAAVWPKVPPWRRLALMEDIEQLSENDTLLSFVSLASFAVQDEDPKVRLTAVRTLWNYEDPSLVSIFLNLIDSDSQAEVRAAAAGALGRFVYAGELEEIPANKLRKIEDRLLQVMQGDDTPAVRRSALESLGYSSREEVIPLIQDAFNSKEKEWKASALFAMGRSGDESWNPQVLGMLQSHFPLLRGEAARAAGELEIAEAVPYLIELIDDPDDTTHLASIWSLSQIGGEGVRETLEKLYEDMEDEGDLEFLESALDNLAFTEGSQPMPLYDFYGYEEEDEYEKEDLEDLFNDDEDQDW
jgi:HEAT repeat protein